VQSGRATQYSSEPTTPMEKRRSSDGKLHRQMTNSFRLYGQLLESKHNVARSIQTPFGTIESYNSGVDPTLLDPRTPREKDSSDGKLRTRLVTGSCSRSTSYRFTRTIARVKPRPSKIYPKSLSVRYGTVRYGKVRYGTVRYGHTMQ
jgi:hypothetical protein